MVLDELPSLPLAFPSIGPHLTFARCLPDIFTHCSPSLPHGEHAYNSAAVFRAYIFPVTPKEERLQRSTTHSQTPDASMRKVKPAGSLIISRTGGNDRAVTRPQHL